MTLADTRMALAELRNLLRVDKAYLESIKAIAEFRAVIDGKNEGERARQLAYILSQDRDYQAALRACTIRQNDVEHLQAEVAIAEDAQLEARLATVNRLADALTALAHARHADSVIVEAALPDDWYKK